MAPATVRQPEARHAAALRAAERSVSRRREVRLRLGTVWRLHGAGRRQGLARSCVTPDRHARQFRDHHHRRRSAPSRSRTLYRKKPSSTSRPHNAAMAINGMIMKAKELLDQKPHPSDADVREALAGHLCRCGTHNRIVAAVVQRAARNRRRWAEMNAPTLTRREKASPEPGQGLGGLVLAFSLDPAELRAQGAGSPRPGCWVASTTIVRCTPGFESAATATPPSIPARWNWGRAS